MSFSLYGHWYDLRQHLAKTFSVYWHYRPNRWYLLIAIFTQFILWFFAYRLFISVGSDLFVSHYNVDFGIDGIGSSSRAFIAPALAAAVLFFNTIFILILGKREHSHFLTHASSLATVAVQVLAALTLMSLYLINFLA